MAVFGILHDRGAGEGESVGIAAGAAESKVIAKIGAPEKTKMRTRGGGE
jgi:hypothetical protein